MKFTKSELEVIFQYASTTKEETIDKINQSAPAIKYELSQVIMRNAVEKLNKIPEPECSRFIAENKAHFIEKKKPSVLRRLAEAKERIQQPILQGHDLSGIERFQPDTRHMITLDVLTSDSPVGFVGERYRFFLSDRAYQNARDSEKRGEIKIRNHAAVMNGKIHHDKSAEHGR